MKIFNAFKGSITGMFVDENGRAHTLATTKDFEESAAEDGDSFILHAECHLAAATSGGLLYFTNTSPDKEYHIGRIYIDPQTITPADLLVTQVFDPATKTGGTNISETGIINKNTGRSTTLTATLRTSDASSDITFTGGTQYHAFPITSRLSVFRDMKGTNIIFPGKTILWGWRREGGGGATDAEKISLSINLYQEPVGV